VPDMFCHLYLVISHTIAITEGREKISTDLESLEFKTFFDVCLTKFEKHQILLNKVSTRCLVTTKVLSGSKSLILQ